jgi:hypothetical protein
MTIHIGLIGGGNITDTHVRLARFRELKSPRSTVPTSTKLPVSVASTAGSHTRTSRHSWQIVRWTWLLSEAHPGCALLKALPLLSAVFMC